MRSITWPILASMTLLAGGASWLVKIGVIVATDGRIATAGSAALLMSTGLVLLASGAAGLGAALVGDVRLPVRIGAALGAVVVVAACTVALGSVATALLRGHGPAYVSQEAGIFVAGLLWLAVGALGVRGFQRVEVARNPAVRPW